MEKCEMKELAGFVSLYQLFARHIREQAEGASGCFSAWLPYLVPAGP
jgi:hypothetical protein